MGCDEGLFHPLARARTRRPAFGRGGLPPPAGPPPPRPRSPRRRRSASAAWGAHPLSRSPREFPPLPLPPLPPSSTYGSGRVDAMLVADDLRGWKRGEFTGRRGLSRASLIVALRRRGRRPPGPGEGETSRRRAVGSRGRSARASPPLCPLLPPLSPRPCQPPRPPGDPPCGESPGDCPLGVGSPAPAGGRRSAHLPELGADLVSALSDLRGEKRGESRRKRRSGAEEAARRGARGRPRAASGGDRVGRSRGGGSGAGRGRWGGAVPVRLDRRSLRSRGLASRGAHLDVHDLTHGCDSGFCSCCSRLEAVSGRLAVVARALCLLRAAGSSERERVGLGDRDGGLGAPARGKGEHARLAARKTCVECGRDGILGERRGSLARGARRFPSPPKRRSPPARARPGLAFLRPTGP